MAKISEIVVHYANGCLKSRFFCSSKLESEAIDQQIDVEPPTVANDDHPDLGQGTSQVCSFHNQ